MPIFFPIYRFFFRPKKRTGVKKLNYNLLVRDSLFLIMEPGCPFINGPCMKEPSHRLMGCYYCVNEKRSPAVYQSPSSKKQSGGRSLQFFADLT